MRKSLWIMRAGVFALAVVWGQGLLAASLVVHVGTCEVPGNSIVTIQEGVNAASSGDTVRVCPGTYPEQITINEPLTITGVHVGTSDAVVIVPPSGGLTAYEPNLSPLAFRNRIQFFQILITATAGNVNLNNLTVDGMGNNLLAPCPINPPEGIVGIYYRGAFGGTVKNVALRNQFIDPSNVCGVGAGVLVESAVTTAGAPLNINVTIEESSIRAFEVFAIAENGFGVGLTIKGNTMGPGLDNPNFIENDLQLVGAQGSFIGNKVIGVGGQLGSCFFGSSTHGFQIVGNTVGNCGTGIVLSSADGVGDADDGNITGNVVFDTTGTDLAIDDAGIALCSSHNLVQGNEINGSIGVAIYTDTCGNTTFGSTGNTIQSNKINEACAGVLQNTAGNIVSSNQFQNVFETVAHGNHCP